MKKNKIFFMMVVIFVILIISSCNSNKTNDAVKKATNTLKKEIITKNLEPDKDIIVVKGEVSADKYNNDEPSQGECSWYCGVGAGVLDASSTLKTDGSISYSARNADDTDLRTAWVEGISGYGIGEYINYELNSAVPNAILTEVRLFNGYRKSDILWSENSRVKSLKMYIDNKPYAVLEAVDTKELQTFNVGRIKLIRDEVLKIKLEIIDVYKGSKYDDTAITEIEFSGEGVH